MRKAYRNRSVPATVTAPDHKPKCRDCDSDKNVVKHMGRWICNVHLMVKNTRIKEGPLGEQIVLPLGVETPFSSRPEWSFGELFVNRAHRRSVGHAHGLG